MSSPLYLLDTGVLLVLIRGGPLGKYIRTSYRLDDAVYRPSTSVVSHGEIWVLAERNNWGTDKREKLKNMLDSVVTVDINNQAVLDAYVALDRASQKVPKGARVLSDNDLWIAATASATSAVLLTTDKDFLHFHPDHCHVEYIDQDSRLAESP